MDLEVKKPFKNVMNIVDMINPYIVIVSIIGLILEYTSVPKVFEPIVYINQSIDVYFVLEFLFRLLAYSSSKKYFSKNYGWVDMLAGIPGLMVFFGGNSLLSLVKITRVGKFFKMIRILRFLRMFSFLKKMKSDSKYIQDRLMKIGVSTVLVVICGLFLVDFLNYGNLVSAETEKIHYYADIEGGTSFLKNMKKFDIVAYRDGNQFIFITPEAKVNTELSNKENYEMLINSNDYSEIKVDQLPDMAFAFSTRIAQNFHNTVMLVLVLTLVFLLLLQLFYVGSVLAKDVRIIQLIVDSFEAEDFFLFSEEKRQVEEEEGTIEVRDGEDEMTSLRKVIGKISEKTEELEKREEDINNTEYMIYLKEEAAKNEKLEMKDAIEETAEAIYERIKTDTNADNEIDDLDDEINMKIGGGLDSNLMGEDSSYSDNEELIKNTAEKIKEELKNYWESEGIKNINKKIISETINKIMPKIKEYLKKK